MRKAFIQTAVLIFSAALLISCTETSKMRDTLAGFPSLLNDWTQSAFKKEDALYGVPLLGHGYEQVLDIQEVQGQNGVAAWLVEDHNVPVISIRFAFRGGAVLDPEGKEGLAHLTSTLLNEGAGDLDAHGFQKIMTDNAIDIYFSASRDAFYGQVRTTRENKDQAFELLKLALTKPRFDDEAVERMKNAVITGLKMKQSSPDWHAGRTMNEVVYDGHPYAKPTQGTPETIAAITRNDLQSFVDGRLARGNVMIAVAGDINVSETQAMLDETFGALPAYALMPPVPEAEMRAKGETVLMPWDGAQSVVLMVQEGLRRENKDWIAAKLIDYTLAGGGFKSRLMQELRVDRGLTYGVGSALVDREYAPVWLVQTSVDNKSAAEAVQLIKDQWHFMAAAGMTEEELESAQSFMIGALPLALDSTGAIASVMLQMQEDGLPKDYLNRRTAEINAITTDDIRRVASTYLKPEELTTIVVGTPEDLTADRVIEKK